LVITNSQENGTPRVEFVMVGRTVVDQPIPPSSLIDLADIEALQERHQTCGWQWPDTLECGIVAHVLAEFLANCHGKRDPHAEGLAAENRCLEELDTSIRVIRSRVEGTEDAPSIVRELAIDGVLHREVIQADSIGRIVSVTCSPERSTP
jgi:hypothetical protein